MGLSVMPKAHLSDADVADALRRAVRVADMVLDVLAEADPLGLRRRSHDLGDSAGTGCPDRVLDLAARLLDCADLPGTQSWDRKDRKARIHWWVRRVGALDTIFVAFPGVFGALVKRLPLQDVFGFANQTLVLCAVAREYGITDAPTQVRLLASVLCGREIDKSCAATGPEESWPDLADRSLVGKLWHLAAILNAVGDELGKRPHPRSIFRYFGMLPWIGAVADYLGEYGALVRAAAAGETWIMAQDSEVDKAESAPDAGEAVTDPIA
ncbi:hypothetical protein [Mycolicibacterium brisbanense]|uniref:Uncharacterized protein n=1 Tax=Mycolicibacterium brisbanense TaxID=146020 RepID=A0A124E028_9MYCO|nr:hypothetical protein [Mycolicibacterium brisbanense]GAS89225.1 uncharacterized protein RMCB_3321 [Mycolicibacterium brisbanense]